MPLSKENRERLILTGLYILKDRPTDTWCKNYTFTLYLHGEDIYLIDTYYSDMSTLKRLTDDNFNQFKLVMDYDKVEQTSLETWEQYLPEKRFNYAVDSGGWAYSKYFVLKDAKPSRELVQKTILNEIKKLEFSLEYNKKKLSEINDDLSYE